MTYEEAKELVSELLMRSRANGDAYAESFWLTISEALGVWHYNTVPEDDRRVLCCTRTKAGAMNIVIGYYSDRWVSGMNSNVIAWMELPKCPEVEE